MNDIDKMIIEEMRAGRKETNDNLVLIHQKIEKVKDDLQGQISGVKSDVQMNKESFIIFKAKWAGVGALAIFIGNLIKPVWTILKAKL